METKITAENLMAVFRAALNAIQKDEKTITELYGIKYKSVFHSEIEKNLRELERGALLCVDYNQNWNFEEKA